MATIDSVHFYSRGWGFKFVKKKKSRKNYPKQSLKYLKKINKIAFKFVFFKD